MIEVVIDSVRVSLMSQHRIVVLREDNGERNLSVQIGPFDADAITVQLQDIEAGRPMKQVLLSQIAEPLDGEITNANTSTHKPYIFMLAKTTKSHTSAGRRPQKGPKRRTEKQHRGLCGDAAASLQARAL